MLNVEMMKNQQKSYVDPNARIAEGSSTEAFKEWEF